MKETYINVTQEQGRDFVMQQLQGRVVMLNLLRFRETADYSAHPELAPETPISGKEAYSKYMACTTPFLEEAGSRLHFAGEAGKFLIGPTDETWDLVLLVDHESVDKFLAFAANKDYLKIAGHRTAALADSRLLPLTGKSSI